jgi:integrase
MAQKLEPTNKPGLYRRGDTYYARIYQSGTSKWISLKTTVKGVALAKLAKHTVERHAVRNAETASQRGSATIGDLSELYLRSQEIRTDIKPGTLSYRRKTVAYLLRSWPELKGLTPTKIDKEDCQEWFADYSDEFSSSLSNNTLDSLKGILDIAVERGMIARNPADGIERIRVGAKRLLLPSQEEFKKLVETIRNRKENGYRHHNADVVEFLAYSGLRISEARAITWADVLKDQIYVRPGKNDQSRHVPILPGMRDLLLRLREMPRCYRDPQREAGNYVLSVTSCSDALAAACRTLKLHHLTHHDLRHLFATRCIESGVDIPTVSRWLGHQDGGALAMKVYGHLRDDHSQSMAAKVQF